VSSSSTASSVSTAKEHHTLFAVLFRKGDKVVCFTKISIIQNSVIRYSMELVLLPPHKFARYCWRRWKTFFFFIQRH